MKFFNFVTIFHNLMRNQVYKIFTNDVIKKILIIKFFVCHLRLIRI